MLLVLEGLFLSAQGGCYHPTIDLLGDNIQQEQKEPSVWLAFFVDKYGCFY
ncbi:MAG: hypothetical protein Q8O10_10485 [candidate division Zixibacteria bacterium]|nr:hypothetical protein [candidate division Zixibacteria bacterium]